jgi:hypothetical protein
MSKPYWSSPTIHDCSAIVIDKMVTHDAVAGTGGAWYTRVIHFKGPGGREISFSVFGDYPITVSVEEAQKNEDEHITNGPAWDRQDEIPTNLD